LAIHLPLVEDGRLLAKLVKHDEPWDTIDLDQGTLEIHEPDFPGYIGYIVWKGKDGDVEYYKIKLDTEI
jgi:hypothetical protein